MVRLLLVTTLLAVCAAALGATPAVAQYPGQWILTPEYKSCSVSLYGEGFASLNVDNSTLTNYLGSTVWINNARGSGEQFDVKGTGAICVTPTGLQPPRLSDPRMPLTSCDPKLQPPLGLYQCIPYPNLLFCLSYLALGVPFVLLMLFYLHHHHRIALKLPQDRCISWGSQLYGQWNLIFTNVPREETWKAAVDSGLAAETDSTHWLYIRWLECDHSLFCFFFISPMDHFNWKLRLFAFILEQALNFSTQALFTTIVYVTQGDSTSGTAVSVVCTVTVCLALSVVFPVRRLLCYLMRRKADTLGAACGIFLARIYLVFSVIGIFVWTLVCCIYVGNGGKDEGGQAPNDGPSLLSFAIVAYIAAIPFHFLTEVIVSFMLFHFCTNKAETKHINHYTTRFCVNLNSNPLKAAQMARELQDTMHKAPQTQTMPAPVAVGVQYAAGHGPQPMSPSGPVSPSQVQMQVQYPAQQQQMQPQFAPQQYAPQPMMQQQQQQPMQYAPQPYMQQPMQPQMQMMPPQQQQQFMPGPGQPYQAAPGWQQQPMQPMQPQQFQQPQYQPQQQQMPVMQHQPQHHQQQAVQPMPQQVQQSPPAYSPTDPAVDAAVGGELVERIAEGLGMGLERMAGHDGHAPAPNFHHHDDEEHGEGHHGEGGHHHGDHHHGHHNGQPIGPDQVQLEQKPPQ